LATEHVSIKGQIVLEEYNFTVSAPPPGAIVEALAPLVPADDVWSGIARQLVIVPDDIFMHFCEHACEVVTRIKIDDKTGTVADGHLFNQEQAPSETLFYTLLMAEQEKGSKDSKRTAKDALNTLKVKVEETDCLQIGGDATIGLGFCSAYCQEVK
jgi:CRISPR-associated protein Cmr4